MLKTMSSFRLILYCRRLTLPSFDKKIYNRSDKEINKLYDEGKKESLKHFDEIYKKLDTRFDHYFFEGTEGRDGVKIVEENLQKGIFEKSEGAVVFKGEKYGLHTRVFVNSKGVPTYEAKELGLGMKKINEFNFDKSKAINAFYL